MLVKDIVDKFFENPFWYFEGKTDPIDVEPRTQSSLSFAKHLQHLYEQFLIGEATNPFTHPGSMTASSHH
jgi:hypothetical protein